MRKELKLNSADWNHANEEELGFQIRRAKAKRGGEEVIWRRGGGGIDLLPWRWPPALVAPAVVSWFLLPDEPRDGNGQ
jgi:hypothetical protein